MKVSALQTKNIVGDQASAFLAAERLIQLAAARGSRLIVLPELSSCGFLPNEQIWQYAEKANGKTVQWACEMAAKYAIFVGAGYLETDGHDIFNTYLIAEPGGKAAGQVRKIQVEPYCFCPSDIGSVIETELGKLAIGIGADSHMAWFYHRLAAMDFDLLLLPHAAATPFSTDFYIRQKDLDTQRNTLLSLGGIYASGFGVPVVFANPVGQIPPMRGLMGAITPPKRYRLGGGSGIFLPDGQVFRREMEEEGIVTADMTPGKRAFVPVEPAVYEGFLYPGSRFIRDILAPMDIVRGKRFYQNHHKES